MDSSVWYNPLSWEGAWIWMWLGLYFIIFCRAGATYLLGRAVRAGVSRFTTVQKVLASSVYQRAEYSLDRWGAPVIALSFLTVGFQTAVNLGAGVARMHWTRYLPALLVGGALWATVYTGVGSIALAAIGAAYTRWPVVTIIITLGLVAALIALIMRRLTAKKHRSAEKIDS